MVDVNDPSRGTRPYRRDYANPISLQTRQARDSNYAFYLQDSWRPNDRLTANVGIRFDYVKRVDEVRDITRQKSWSVQPRIGATYLLTNDAKNVLRASYGRLGEQVMGRDGVTIFGADDTVSFRREYDNDLNGTFETTQLAAGIERPPWPASRSRPACTSRTSTSSSSDSAGSSAGRLAWTWATSTAPTSTCGRTSTSTASIPTHRVSPSEVSAESIRTRDMVQQQTNNTWSQLKYQAIEVTATKNMSRGFQLIGGFTRQWHKIDGTWNPTDPARFVQPNHFANDANLYMPRGNNDGNSLPDTGNALSYGPTWMKYRGNLGGVWQAPWRINVAASATFQAGPWSGAPLYQLAANDPDVLKYGPATFTLANGSTAPNPLATRNRYVFSDRGEGQVAGAADHDGRPEDRQDPAVSALPARGCGERLQPSQWWGLHAIQLQQRLSELELELPVDGQSAAGASVPVDGGRPLLKA